MTWVVSDRDTGYSDESMRFATRSQMQDWLFDTLKDTDLSARYDTRWESSEEASAGEVAVAQIWHDGGWLDYARSTPEKAISWAQDQPVALARVVDWIDKGQVIWP